MVNASLNWASIIGIVLALVGLILVFKRDRISRPIDQLIGVCSIFCGAILFFQGWRLDPILQFGQVLLITISIFIGVDNMKLRRALINNNSSAFDDEPIKREVIKRSSNFDDNDWGNKTLNNSSYTSYSERKISSSGLKCSYCGARVE